LRKIPTIFIRDLCAQPALVTPEVTPGCEWVIAGEGVATRKYDGMCCAMIDGDLWKRREVKLGKPVPSGFVQTDEDSVTGKKFGWLLCGTGPDDKYFRAAVGNRPVPESGTYELLGPKVQGNPEGYESLYLMKHSKALVLLNVPLTFYGLWEYLKGNDIEGIVFHHEDGRMAKIKGKDFGIKRAKLT
jgi:hypothetical protein